MSHSGQENQGTGLGDVFDVLVKAPSERLVSLTLQLSESPEDNIIHALCLIILQRETQALDKLQALKDNYLAKHLAEKWQMSDGKVEDFAVHCGHFQEFTLDSLVLLARIFKALSEKRLCDPHLRNLAYKRALSRDEQKTPDCENLEYDHLREEAKVVCGPQFTEWMGSSMDIKSESYCDLYTSLGKGSTTMKVTLSQDQSERAHILPSPLQASSSVLSYPTHLEISIPPTALFQENGGAPETSETSKLNAAAQSQKSEEPQLKSCDHPELDDRLAAERIKSDSHIAPIKSTKPAIKQCFAPPTAMNIVLPTMPVATEMHESNGAEEVEEETFYAFVILHAPEDADMAESMREKVEKIIGSEGATFSDDFATPGKSTLRCVEDAINNTAFTLLLLTHNFNTRMLDLETNSALTNSLTKKHKFNTVIPLLPRENCMPKQSIPLVLQTIVPLEENRNFERKTLKSLSPASIKRQQKIWAEEQREKIQMERQKQLQQKKKLIKEREAAQLLEKEILRLSVTQKLLLGPSGLPEQDGEDGRAWWQQQPNIHIENAKYIMIGNDSQMTVDLGGGADKDDSSNWQEE